MRLRWGSAMLVGLVVGGRAAMLYGKTPTENAKGDKTPTGTFFRTSERCVACHNGLTTSSGEDISIGFEWRASIMANSSRDPYWQGSVRRESIDHPESKQAIEDECSICHMPAVRLADRDAAKAYPGVFPLSVQRNSPREIGRRRRWRDLLGLPPD